MTRKVDEHNVWPLDGTASCIERARKMNNVKNENKIQVIIAVCNITGHIVHQKHHRNCFSSLDPHTECSSYLISGLFTRHL